LYVRQHTGYLQCIATDLIRFTPLSTIDCQPTPHSTPVHARPTIQGKHGFLLSPPLHLYRQGLRARQPLQSSSALWNYGKQNFSSTLHCTSIVM
jgi:hypothetical protein